MMDHRTRSPAHIRRKSASTTSEIQSFSTSSPNHRSRHVRSGSTDAASYRKTHNYAAKAAAQRLAEVMSHQNTDDVDEGGEDDFSPDFKSTSSVSIHCELATGRPYKSQSPMSAWSSTESSPPPPVVMKPVVLIPSIRPSLKPLPHTPPSGSPMDNRRNRRLSMDLGNLVDGDIVAQRSTSALQDEIDMLREENADILDKLQHVEEKYKEAEARSKELEKQIASFGDDVSFEGNLLSRKEASLQQREAALRAATQTKDKEDKVLQALQLEIEMARDATMSVMEQLHEVESEVKSLREMSSRMFLSKEQMEEVVLKRCWLARYWKLCIQFGIHAEIAELKSEYWSSIAPIPVEIVMQAGKKAREYNQEENIDLEDSVSSGTEDFSGERNIENMLLVEKGLQELASLKVEDAVWIAMSAHHHPQVKSGLPHLEFSDLNMQTEGQSPRQAFELGQDATEDVLFKQAWLTYFWRKAKDHGIEMDIAENRLEFWLNRTQTPNSHDAIDVERGLRELKRLRIDNRIWEVSRKEIRAEQDTRGFSFLNLLPFSYQFSGFEFLSPDFIVIPSHEEFLSVDLLCREEITMSCIYE